MLIVALCAVLSLVLMIYSAFLPSVFGSMVVFVLGLLLLGCVLWAYCEMRYNHRAGQWRPY